MFLHRIYTHQIHYLYTIWHQPVLFSPLYFHLSSFASLTTGNSDFRLITLVLPFLISHFFYFGHFFFFLRIVFRFCNFFSIFTTRPSSLYYITFIILYHNFTFLSRFFILRILRLFFPLACLLPTLVLFLSTRSKYQIETPTPPTGKACFTKQRPFRRPEPVLNRRAEKNNRIRTGEIFLVLKKGQ